MRASGKTVAITGATGGIGRALAAEFAAAGAHLVVHGRDPVAVGAMAEAFGARAVVADLRDRGQVERLVGELAAVDVLVLNAAVRAAQPADELGRPALDDVLDVNLRAPIVLASEVGAAMAARGSGQIVLVSSLAAMASASGSEVYSATKAGVRLFGHGLRDRFGPNGVGVTVVLPGYVGEAGMFAADPHELPPGFGVVSPRSVARSVRRAVERDRAEVVPASPLVRAAGWFAGAMPTVAVRVARASALQRALPER